VIRLPTWRWWPCSRLTADLARGSLLFWPWSPSLASHWASVPLLSAYWPPLAGLQLHFVHDGAERMFSESAARCRAGFGLRPRLITSPGLSPRGDDVPLLPVAVVEHAMRAERLEG